MTFADFSLSVIAGENAAKKALARIADGTADQYEISLGYVSLLSEAERAGNGAVTAAVFGFHRAIQKRLEAI
jgi:hypothetical protein